MRFNRPHRPFRRKPGTTTGGRHRGKPHEEKPHEGKPFEEKPHAEQPHEEQPSEQSPHAERSAGPLASSRRRLLITSATVVSAVLVAGLALRDASGPDSGTAGSKADCRPTALLEPPCGAWFGAFVPHERDNLPEKVRAYEKRVGRALDIVYTYHDMSLASGTRREGQLLTPEEQRVGEDHLLLLSWESKWWGGTKQQQPTWKQIASGALDDKVIDVQARRIKDYGKKVFLSFDLEMDTRTPANGTPADYVKAYRHIHDRFRELGVDNVVWTWITTGYLDHADEIKKMYPGDDYVDWVGYNQYNYYRCHDAGWLTFAQTQAATHDWIRANISDDKPLMLSEFGTAADANRPERQAEWYARVPGVLKGLDGVKAALQWNYRDPGPHCNLAVANDVAWDSLRKAVADPYLNQPLR